MQEARIRNYDEVCSVITSDNFHLQITRPEWLVDTIAARANLILQLYRPVGELRDWLRYNKGDPQVLALPWFEE